MFSSSIQLTSLAALCDRMAMTLAAGIDLRSAWGKEASRATGRAKRVFEQIAADLERGETMAAALAQTDSFFPPLFVELLSIGETSGHLPEMLRQLKQQYQMQIDARRTFQLAIAWPAVQLLAAIFIVGGLIWIMGIIGDRGGGEPFDPLGVGLVGGRGAAVYFAIICGVAVCGWIALQAAKSHGPIGRGLRSTARRLPLVGGVVKCMSLARFCWSLGLGLSAAMDVPRAATLAIRAARNPRLSRAESRIAQELEQGNSIGDSFATAGALPIDLLHEMDVGETSGLLPETLLQQAQLYNVQTKTRLNLLAVVGSFLCWALVAGLIILVIFRLFFTFILGPYRDFGLI